MSPGASRDDELLRRILESGDAERAWEEGSVDGALDLREELEEIVDIEQLLDRAGDEHRATLAEVDSLEGVPGEDLVREVLRPRIASRRRTNRLRLLSRATGAAAALFLALFFLLRDPGGEPGPVLPPGIPMGVVIYEELEPSGPGGDFRRFAWEVELTGVDSFTLTVRGLVDGEVTEPLARIYDLEESEWSPSNEYQRSWPDTILWDLRAVDAADQVVERWSTWASRP